MYTSLFNSLQKLLLFTFFLSFNFSTIAQSKAKELEYYSNGQNGIQFIAKSKKGTVIVSNYNAKMTIRADIAKKVYDLFLKNQIKSNEVITVIGKEAKVIGKFEIVKKGNMTNLNFYYQKVEWNNGLVEIYKAG